MAVILKCECGCGEKRVEDWLVFNSAACAIRGLRTLIHPWWECDKSGEVDEEGDILIKTSNPNNGVRIVIWETLMGKFAVRWENTGTKESGSILDAQQDKDKAEEEYKKACKEYGCEPSTCQGGC